MHYLIHEFDWTSSGLVFGCSLSLVIGVIAVMLTRPPAVKQRIVEATMLATAVWFLIALIPFARIDLRDLAKQSVQLRFDRSEMRVNRTPHFDPQGLHRNVIDGLPGDRLVDRAGATHALTSPLNSQLSPPMVASAFSNEASTASTNAWYKQIAWIVYLATAGAIALWMIVPCFLLKRLRWKSHAPPEWVQQLYEGIEKSRVAELLICDRDVRPMSFGLRRSIIILPVGLLSDGNERILRHVLMHEQVHVDRRDSIGNLIINLAMPFLWIHPLYWCLRRVAVYSRELIADDVTAAKSDKTHYVQDLLTLLDTPAKSNVGFNVSLGVLGFRNSFSQRMAALLERDARLEAGLNRKASLLISAGALVGCILATASLGARPLEPPPSKSDLASGAELDLTAEQEEKTVSSAAKAEPTTEHPATEDLDLHDNSEDAQEAGLTFKHAIASPSKTLTVRAAVDGKIDRLVASPGVTVKTGNHLLSMTSEALDQQFQGAYSKLIELQVLAKDDINVRDAKATAEMEKAKVAETKALLEKKAIPMVELLKAEAQLDRANLRIELAELNSAANEARLMAQQAVMTLLKRQRDSLELTAGIDGVIESVAVQRGEWVKAGTELFTIVQLENIQVEFSAPTEQVSAGELIDKNVLIEFRMPKGKTRKQLGRIEYVSASLGVSQELRAVATCKNVRQGKRWMFLPGMLASVTLLPGDEAQSERDATVSSDSNEEELALLRVTVEQQKKLLARAKEQLNGGVVTKLQVAEIERDYRWSEARLAKAERDVERALQAYKEAIAASTQLDKASQQIFEIDGSSLDITEASRASLVHAQLRQEWFRYQRAHPDVAQ